MLYKLINRKLEPIKEIKIELEEDIQKIIEENLNELLGLGFVRREFTLQNFRIDTLAFDAENKSFVIIEYNEKMNKGLKRENVDWSQSKIIFIANSFTTYQQNAIRFKDLPIELWEVKRFDNSMILLNQILSPESSESIKTVSGSEVIKSVNREVKSYSVEDHFKKNWEKSKEIFEELHEKILSLDGRLAESPQKEYIGYKLGRSNVVSLRIYESKVRLELTRTRPQDVRDPDQKVKARKNSFKYFGQNISYFDILSEDDIDYAFLLAKQVYERLSKEWNQK